jgi:hypothetical protein
MQQVETRLKHARRQGAQSTIEKVRAYSSREVYGKTALHSRKVNGYKTNFRNSRRTTPPVQFDSRNFRREYL